MFDYYRYFGAPFSSPDIMGPLRHLLDANGMKIIEFVGPDRDKALLLKRRVALAVTVLEGLSDEEALLFIKFLRALVQRLPGTAGVEGVHGEADGFPWKYITDDETWRVVCRLADLWKEVSHDEQG